METIYTLKLAIFKDCAGWHKKTFYGLVGDGIGFISIVISNLFRMMKSMVN